MKTPLWVSAITCSLLSLALTARAADNPDPPPNPVKLIFIHHSTGEDWLNDGHGELGIALSSSNYFVSDTNYGWGPDSIGDTTDIGHWWTWFRGPNSATYMAALFAESGQHCSYTRSATDPGGANEIVMFKSCFPNSGLQGSPSDPVPSIGSNPLKGEACWSSEHTVANAKGIYTDLLEYFRLHQEKLFVVIAAPPLQSGEWADNARAFNRWLVNDWLDAYPHNNVFVFDFYNVLTTNGGDENTNDLGSASGNHHRWWSGAVQYKTDGDDDASPNVLEYWSPGHDDHPSPAGGRKATAEFVPLLNVAYHRWKEASGRAPTSLYTIDRTGVIGDLVILRAYLSRSSDGTKLPGKVVEFAVDGSSAGSAVTDVNGRASLSFIAPSPAGPHPIIAEFAGDASWEPSTAEATLTSTTVATKISVPDRAGTLRRDVWLKGYLYLSTGSIPLPGRALTFRIEGSVVGSAVTNSIGRAQYVYTLPEAGGAGVRALAVEFAGMGGYLASTGSAVLTVSRGLLYMWTISRSVVPGMRLYLRAYVRSLPDYVWQPGKSIAFSIDGTGIGAADTDGSGRASVLWTTPAGFGVGSHELRASFGGDVWYEPASAVGTLIGL